MLADKLRTASLTSRVFEIASYAAAKNAPGDITIDKPSGTATGDLLVMALCNGASLTTDPASFTTPSGWTLRANDTDTPHLTVFTKVAGASEPASYTVVWGGADPDGSSGIILRITKANYSTIGTLVQSTSTTVTATSISTGVINTIFIVAAAKSTSTNISSYTGSFIEFYDTQDGTADTFNGFGIGTKQDGNGGASGDCTVTFSGSAGNNQAVIIAVTEA